MISKVKNHPEEDSNRQKSIFYSVHHTDNEGQDRQLLNNSGIRPNLDFPVATFQLQSKCNIDNNFPNYTLDLIFQLHHCFLMVKMSTSNPWKE